MSKNAHNYLANHGDATPEPAASPPPLVLDDDLQALLYNTVARVEHVEQLVSAKFLSALCDAVPSPLETGAEETETFRRFLTRVQSAILKLRSKAEALGIGRGAESAEAIAAGIPPLLTEVAKELTAAANDFSPRFQIQKLAEGVRNAAAAVTTLAESFTLEKLKDDALLDILLKAPSGRTLEVESFFNVPKVAEQSYTAKAHGVTETTVSEQSAAIAEEPPAEQEEKNVSKRRKVREERRPEGEKWPADLLINPLAPVMARITEVACTVQIRKMLAEFVSSFLEQCRASDIVFQDEDERSAGSQRVKAMFLSFAQALENATRECCRRCQPLQPAFATVQESVRNATQTVDATSLSIPKPVMALFRRAIVTAMSDAWEKQETASAFEAYHTQGFDASPNLETVFDVLPLPTQDEMRTEQEKIALCLAPLKHGFLLAMLRNICSALPRTRVAIRKKGNSEEIERYAVSSSSFSVGWIAHMLRGIEDTLTNHVKRNPRRKMDIDQYVGQCFHKQGVIFSRAGRDVEQEFKKLTPTPDEKVLTAMRRSLPMIVREQKVGEVVPSTPEELETFMVKELLGGRCDDDGLFPQEAETVKQWCINTLETGKDVDEQMRHHLPALQQLAVEFDRTCHADYAFRRRHSDETLLSLVRPIAAQVLLHRRQRDEDQKCRLKELAGEQLPEKVAQLELLNGENEAWLQSWPARHRRDRDVIGFAEIRHWHENACAYVERCELQGGEAAGFTLARFDAETVRLAREQGVIVVEEEIQEGEQRTRTRRTLKQDTTKVWAFLEQRRSRRELLVGGTSSDAHEIHTDVQAPLAILLQHAKEMPDLERRLSMLPDHTSNIAEIEARLTAAREEQEKLQSLLDELEDSRAEGIPTQEALSERGNDILACIRGLRASLPEERAAEEAKLREAQASLEKAQDQLDDYARGGGMDPPVVNAFNKAIGDATGGIERITKCLEERRDDEIASALDELELTILEHLDHFESSDAGKPFLKPTDSVTTFHALQKDVTVFGEQCEKHVRLRDTAMNEQECAAHNAELKRQISDDAQALKGLRKEQSGRDKVSSRLEELRRIVASVGNALAQPSSTPSTDARDE